MTVCRGIRGATTADENTRASIFAATQELIRKMIEANELRETEVAAAFLTTTQDLNAAFPATAAREMGWNNTAFMCGHEMAVPNSLPRCIRVLILVNTDKEPQELVNVYLKGAVDLRAESMES